MIMDELDLYFFFIQKHISSYYAAIYKAFMWIETAFNYDSQ